MELSHNFHNKSNNILLIIILVVKLQSLFLFLAVTNKKVLLDLSRFFDNQRCVALCFLIITAKKLYAIVFSRPYLVKNYAAQFSSNL